MFFDAHTHVQFRAFEQDWKAVIDRALGADVWMINVGTQKSTSGRAVDLADRYSEGVYASVGLQPVHTEQLYHGAEEIDSGSASSTKDKERDEGIPICCLCECSIDDQDIWDSFVYGEFEEGEVMLAHGKCHEEFQSASDTLKREKATRVRDIDAKFLRALGIQPLDD